MKRRKRNDLIIHAILIAAAFLTFLPFLALLNNSFRANNEFYVSYFGIPRALKNMVRIGIGDNVDEATPETSARSGNEKAGGAGNGGEEAEASDAVSATEDPNTLGYQWRELTRGYRFSWGYLRGYTLNTLFVALATVLGVVFVASLSGYAFSRYRFPGRHFLFLVVVSIMMIPGVLTLVPGFLLVKELGLLNSYWVLILPYVAGGQIVAIFLFKGFFDGLPEDLFEAARMDGAGHLGIYWNIVMPLSKPIISVVAIINILGVWNNFLWPFITNTDGKYHVIPSGLFLLGKTEAATNFSIMNAAIVLSSIPLLLLFIYATRPFMKGVTSGAFKA